MTMGFARATRPPAAEQLPLSAVLLLLMVAAQPSIALTDAGRLLRDAGERHGGCHANGVWYPEGARIAPDPRSRIVAQGVFVCRGGRWVFERAR